MPVLNINELANAMKPMVIPGETMTVTLIKQGKDQNQAVAYLGIGRVLPFLSIVGRKRKAKDRTDRRDTGHQRIADCGRKNDLR